MDPRITSWKIKTGDNKTHEAENIEMYSEGYW